MIKKDLEKELPKLGEFFLHGSRGRLGLSFGLSTSKKSYTEDVKNSDWDFACQHVKEFHSWQEQDLYMKERGWTECVDKSYLDNDTAFVYEKMLGKNKIQISFRQNLDRYKTIWYLIPEEFYFKYLWKKSENCFPVEERRQFFNTMYGIYDNGRDW